MRLANKSVIVWNTKYDSGRMEDVHVYHLIKGVSWFAQDGASQSVDGTQNARSVVMRIPEELTSGYVVSNDYKSSATIDSNTWTLAIGDRVVPMDTPYPNADVLNDSPAYTVMSVTDNRGKRGGHIKVILQ